MTESLQLLEEYKRNYPRMTFREKQAMMKEINSTFPQKLYDLNRDWILKHLEEVWTLNCAEDPSPEWKSLRILELGTYSGELALHVLKRHPDFSWTGYDIAPVEPVKGLEEFNFHLHQLHKDFYFMKLKRNYDVFITSDTLEHFLLGEVNDIFRKVSDIKHQIHIVDFARGERDAHILNLDQGKFLMVIGEHFRRLKHEGFDNRLGVLGRRQSS